MLKVALSSLCCVIVALGCKTTPDSTSSAKIFGSDIPAAQKPYKISNFRYSYTDAIQQKFDLLNAAAGSKTARSLGIFKASGLDDEGLVLGDVDSIKEGAIFPKERLQFISRSDLMRVDNSQGFVLSYIGPRQTLSPIAFILQSSGEIIFFCDEKEHFMQTELDASSPLKPIRFNCDLNLKENFEIRIRKDEADKTGVVIRFL